MAALPVRSNQAQGDSQSGGEDSTLFRLDGERSDLGRPGSMRFNLLTWVLEERYDKAIQELRDYTKRPSQYPTFHERVERYMMHSIDLIYAIKAKRNFPGIHSLTRAKQQELREKFKEHFKELRLTLLKIEKVEADLRIEDVRSTIYVVRALCFAALAILSLGFVLEITNGLASTTEVVVDDLFSRATDWVFHLIEM